MKVCTEYMIHFLLRYVVCLRLRREGGGGGERERTILLLSK